MPDFDLDTPLIKLHRDASSNDWTIRHAVEGVQIFGSIGSGKTSGSGRMLALKYLRAGFGGLVLTAKQDEKNLWQDYCKATGRLEDLIVIEPGGKHFFNFLEYETNANGKAVSITANIVHVLKTVLKASEEKDTGKRDDVFWDNALDMLMFNIVDLCKLAYGQVSIQDMYVIAQSIPHKLEEISDPENQDKAFVKALNEANRNVGQKLDEWEASLDVETLNDMIENESYASRAFEDVPEFRLLNHVEDFFKDNFIPLSEKTRSIIEFSFTGFLFRFMRDPVFTLFCNASSTLKPEDCLNGKIILLNLPVKIYDKVGRDTQIMFKYIWQRAMEKRLLNSSMRPVFLWADEAQNFLHEHDADYQATARSSRICTVYISQNLPNYYANMGGDRSEYKVKSFLGTLNTKIFHANADIETNRYASDLIGDVEFENQTESKSWGTNGQTVSTTKSSTFEKAVKPEDFVRLKTGSPKNSYMVEGYFHRQGDPFSNGKSCVKMKFNQHYNP